MRDIDAGDERIVATDTPGFARPRLEPLPAPDRGTPGVGADDLHHFGDLTLGVSGVV